MSEEEKGFIPPGVTGDIITLPERPKKKKRKKLLSHKVSIYHTGGQLSFGKQFYHSGIINPEGVSYGGLYWDESNRRLDIAFHDKLKLDYDAQKRHVFQLVHNSKSPLKVSMQDYFEKIGTYPRKDHRYHFEASTDPKFEALDIQIDENKKHVTLNFTNKRLQPTGRAIDEGRINKWLVDYENDPEKFMKNTVKGLSSEDSRWWDLEDEFWQKVDKLCLSPGDPIVVPNGRWDE